MNFERLSDDFDPRIAAWLDLDPHRAPADLLDSVLASFPSIHQRRRSMAPGGSPRQRLAVIAAWAVALVVVATAVLAITKPWSSSVGGFGPPAPAPATSLVRKDWNTDNAVAVTITRDPADHTTDYWRATTYDVIGLQGWSTGQSASTTEPASASLSNKTADGAGVASRSQITFSVQPGAFTGSTVLTPGVPITIDQPVTLTTTSTDGYLSRIDRQGAGAYRVTALVGGAADASAASSVGALRSAGTGYPTEITARYLGITPGTIGPHARALENRVVAQAAGTTPIDLVESIMRILRSNEYTYTTDVRGLQCESLSTVECFATFKQGFCQYYAPTMAVVLRDLHIPTRIVEGFLPGDRTGDTEVIRDNNAHAWVEVYFPGVGWIPFDPTGANVPSQLPAALPS
jgi:transglutaminase-like putative cysteine protease